MNSKKAKALRKRVKLIARKHSVEDWRKAYKIAKRAIKHGLIATMILLVTGICSADELIIPRGCYPIQLQEAFAERGLQLDLDGNDRDETSWGFLKNEGNQYRIYTYKSITREELGMVREITNG